MRNRIYMSLIVFLSATLVFCGAYYNQYNTQKKDAKKSINVTKNIDYKITLPKKTKNKREILELEPDTPIYIYGKITIVPTNETRRIKKGDLIECGATDLNGIFVVNRIINRHEDYITIEIEKNKDQKQKAIYISNGIVLDADNYAVLPINEETNKIKKNTIFVTGDKKETLKAYDIKTEKDIDAYVIRVKDLTEEEIFALIDSFSLEKENEKEIFYPKEEIFLDKR